MVFAAILAAGMSVEKQLEAAQKFLRGIRSLTSYEEVRDKQALHVGVQKALDKVQCFAAAQAAAWLAQVQPDFWGDSQAESFRENVAVKTRPVESYQTRCLDSTGAWACAEGRAADRKVLKRLRTLLLYGQWGATHRDVPPHPILHGFSLIPASYEEVTNAWREQLGWNQMYLSDDLHLAGKWLAILAWHFSIGEKIALGNFSIFSGVDAVHGFYGKLDAAYGLQRWRQKHHHKDSPKKFVVCPCLRMSADVCGQKV